MPTQTTDEELTRTAENHRGQMLAKIYLEIAESAPCRCTMAQHSWLATECPKATWEQAAKMANQTR